MWRVHSRSHWDAAGSLVTRPHDCCLPSWSWVIEQTPYSPRCLKHLHLVSMNSLPAPGFIGWMTAQALPVIHKGLPVTTGHVALFLSLTTALSSTAPSCLSSSRGLCGEQASFSCCAMCLPRLPPASLSQLACSICY